MADYKDPLFEERRYAFAEGSARARDLNRDGFGEAAGGNEGQTVTGSRAA